MSALNNSALIGASGSTGYQISRSVRLRSSASAYFSRTPGSAGNRKTFTISYWIKRGALTGTQYLFQAGSGTTEATWFAAGPFDTETISAGTWTTTGGVTTAVFRDPSAWYHVVIAVDTTQATAANRCKIYVNGVQQAQSTPTLTLNADLAWNNSGVVHYIGARVDSGPRMFFDGYFTEINSIDGQALTPASFGETNVTTGVWQPRKYNGTYGTNGFYLNFADNSNNTAATIGKDSSGNGNNWTPNNISVTAGATYDSMIDVPTPWADGGNGRGNYAVLNRLNADTSALGTSITNGNLTASGTTYAATVYSASMQVPSTGQWYYETVHSTLSTVAVIGIRSYSTASTDVQYYSNGNKAIGGSTSAYGASWTTGDVIGTAIDRNAGTVTFYKNGVSQGSINIPTPTAVFDVAWNYITFASTTFNANFGQRPFAYTPPSGFRALNTQNLPTPTIANGALYMNATLWTGNGSVPRNITGLGFQPDLVWIKSRSNAFWHQLTDSNRGVNKALFSNATDAETTTNVVSAFLSDGFTVNNTDANTNAATYVGWQWKAGGTPAVTNTAGSITSTVSVGATQGFSVVTYTGTGANATVGHGLGVAPRMVIVKSRNTAGLNWPVYHASLPATDGIYLNLTDAKSTTGLFWNSTSPTSAVFSIGTGTAVNQNTATYVAYLFAEVAGFSKFGSYTGNGSADGPFVFCGFRPRWVMIKRTDVAESWYVYDTATNTFNALTQYLVANSSNAESSFTLGDYLSNGFKMRNTAAGLNASGGTYIYAAFSEVGFKYALGR